MPPTANFNKNFPPQVEDVQIYFNQRGMSTTEAHCFFLFYEKKGWRSRKGDFIKSWKNTAYQWISGVLKQEPWRFNKNIH